MLKEKWLELTDEKKKYNGRILNRTKYIKDVYSIKKGTYGPWIESFEKIYFSEESEISDETILLGRICFESRVTIMGKTIIDDAYVYLENLIVSESTLRNISIQQNNFCGAGFSGELKITKSQIIPEEKNKTTHMKIECDGTASIFNSTILFNNGDPGIEVNSGCHLDVENSDFADFSNKIVVSNEYSTENKLVLAQSVFKEPVYLKANNGESTIVESAVYGNLDLIGKFKILNCKVCDEMVIRTYFSDKSEVSLLKCDIGSIEETNKIVFIAKEKGKILAKNSCFYDYARVDSDTNACFITDSLLSDSTLLKNSSVNNCRLLDKASVSNNFYIENYTISGDSAIGKYIDGTDIDNEVFPNTKSIVGNSVRINKIAGKLDFYMLPGFLDKSIAMYCLPIRGGLRRCVILEPGISSKEKYLNADDIVQYAAKEVCEKISDKNDMVYSFAERFLLGEQIIQQCVDKILRDFPGNKRKTEPIKNSLVLFWYCLFSLYLKEPQKTQKAINAMSQLCLLDIKTKTIQTREMSILTETIATIVSKEKDVVFRKIINEIECISNIKTNEKWVFIPEARYCDTPDVF